MNDVVRQFRDFFVSLKLTVVLLVLGMVLVFAATLDQTNLGVWGIQQKWFHAFFVLQDIGGFPVPVFPGGYFIGGLLLINLLAAHIYRLKFTWRKTGIQLVHLGLILLLFGELISGILQQDYSMAITEGETKNYAESYQDNELAIIDTTDPKTDEVVVIPERLLADRGVVQHPKLPFRVVTKEYYPNSFLRLRTTPAADAPPANDPPPLATTGLGVQVITLPLPVTYKPKERNGPSAAIELIGAQGSLGTWLVSQAGVEVAPKEPPKQFPVQRFEHAGRSYQIALRPTRLYHPFSFTLLKFSFDRYVGTQIPKNYSSRIRVQPDDGEGNREVLIYMNNPLRYAGLTFYQASFDGEHTTILQVVRNPGWILPYVACTLMTLGLVLQFAIHLTGFVGKRRALATANA